MKMPLLAMSRGKDNNMIFPIYQFVFFVFAALLVFSSIMVITLRNPVHCALYLILSFFVSAVLWMMLQAEFLALALLFVYVGAVMTLFLFVVMMINVDLSKVQEKFVQYLPLGILLVVCLVGMLFVVLNPQHFPIGKTALTKYGADYNNVQAMGTLLYTNYLYPFEIAAVILLVAIVAAISLVFHGRKSGTKSQNINKQHDARKQDRLRVVKMKVEKQ